MKDDDVARLFDLADLILAVGRLIRPSGDRTTEACSPVESSVMRFISRNPGASARAASEATLLTSSNFSRVLRGLEKKGLVRREADVSDARRLHLYPTVRAREDLQKLRDTWTGTLEEILDDPETVDFINGKLRHIENELIARHRRAIAHR